MKLTGIFRACIFAAAAVLPAMPVYADNLKAAGPGVAQQETAGVIVNGISVSAEEAPKSGTVQGTSASAGTVAGQTSAGEAIADARTGATAAVQSGTAAVAAAQTGTAAAAAAAGQTGADASSTEEVVETTPPTGATGTIAGANSGAPKVITNTMFNGGGLMMLSPDSASQMMSFLITTKNGSLIMVDGGTENETEHLKRVLKEKGGHVAVWLVTHPHSDHVGAMTQILSDPNSGITVDSVYYNFAPIEWYQANEEYRSQMVVDCMAALSRLSPSANHPNIQKGDIITVDDVTIRVMNQPYLFQTNAINNSSVAFRVEMGGKRILFLGDMGIPAGNSFLNEYKNELHELRADIVQMSHHGEHGVDHNVYEAVQPTVCLWCCPEWLWNNDNGSGMNSGPWKTLEVRGWMRQLGVKTHVVEKDGDQVLR